MASSLSFAQDVIRCSLCDNMVEYHCKLCHDKLCSECTSKHLSDKSKKHEVVEYTSEMDTMKRHECPSHKSNNCEIFCRNCKIQVCSKCVVGGHKQHDFMELDDFLEEKRRDILGDINEIERLLLPEFQKQKDSINEEKIDSTIDVISNQEHAICTAVRDFGSKLREKVTQHKKEIKEKENENTCTEQNIRKVLQETKSLLARNDTKAILEYNGIKPELRNAPQPLDNCIPILDVKRLQEEEIASLFGTLIIKTVTKENENDDVVHGENLEGESWFHGFIPREEAERLLKKDGDFLVRETDGILEEGRCFVISAYREKPVHSRILPTELVERLGAKGTIVDLVNHLMTTGEELSSTNLAVLRSPIAREESQLDYNEINLDSKMETVKMDNGASLFQGSFRSIKVYVEKVEGDENIIFKDLMFLRKLHHPNIINLIGFSALRKPTLLVLEYISGGVLLDFLKKKGESITIRTRIKMCQDVANGMAFIHLNKCLHRNIAARSCLIDDASTVKIFDFFMMVQGYTYQSISGSKFPIRWTSPESILSGKYTQFSDVWSFGILMWEVFSSGQTPYNEMANKEAVEKVTTGYIMPSPIGTPKACYDVMLKCWEKTPTNRYRSDELVEKLNELLKNVN